MPPTCVLKFPRERFNGLQDIFGAFGLVRVCISLDQFGSSTSVQFIVPQSFLPAKYTFESHERSGFGPLWGPAQSIFQRTIAALWAFVGTVSGLLLSRMDFTRFEISSRNVWLSAMSRLEF